SFVRPRADVVPCRYRLRRRPSLGRRHVPKRCSDCDAPDGAEAVSLTVRLWRPRMADRPLIRDAAILSQDPDVGVLRTGDILIEDGRIAAVAPHVDASDAALVDGTDLIALPGMVDG